VTNVIEQLRALKNQEPFVPFVIVLKTGRRIEVTRRLQFGFSEHRMGVIDDRDRVDDLRPSDIAEIQPLSPHKPRHKHHAS
jgi:hypothetical protein